MPEEGALLASSTAHPIRITKPNRPRYAVSDGRTWDRTRERSHLRARRLPMAGTSTNVPPRGCAAAVGIDRAHGLARRHGGGRVLRRRPARRSSQGVEDALLRYDPVVCPDSRTAYSRSRTRLVPSTRAAPRPTLRLPPPQCLACPRRTSRERHERRPIRLRVTSARSERVRLDTYVLEPGRAQARAERSRQ